MDFFAFLAVFLRPAFFFVAAVFLADPAARCGVAMTPPPGGRGWSMTPPGGGREGEQ